MQFYFECYRQKLLFKYWMKPFKVFWNFFNCQTCILKFQGYNIFGWWVAAVWIKGPTYTYTKQCFFFQLRSNSNLVFESFSTSAQTQSKRISKSSQLMTLLCCTLQICLTPTWRCFDFFFCLSSSFAPFFVC